MSSVACQPIANATLSVLAPPGYREAYLAFFILFLFFIVLGVFTFFKGRARSGRLAKRSGMLLVFSAAGAVLSCFVVFFREYYGRENVQCLAVLTIHHLLIPLVAGPIVAKVYVHAYRLRRSQVRAGLSFAAVKKEQDRIDRGETNIAHGLAQDISAFVTLQSKKSRSPAGTATSISTNQTHPNKDHFEVVSPVSDGFDIADDDDVVHPASSPVMNQRPKSGLNSSPKRPSKGEYAKRQDSDIDANDVEQGGMSKIGSRSSVVEMSPSPSSPPSSPVATRKGSKKSKSTTEDIVRKASRNSSSVLRQHSRGSKQGSRISSFGGVGWWSPKAQDLESEVHLDELIKNESSIWGMLMVLLFSLPFIAVVIGRSQTDAKYDPTLGCTGCDFEAMDMFILCGLSVFMLSVFLASIIVMWHAPDPLGILWEARLCAVVFVLFGLPCAILYLVDPLGIEKSYHFTWLTFETLAAFFLLMIQTFGQVAYTNWANNRVPKNISLLRLLENVELRDMFDDHLASEFSIENLRFWDRAIHWKISYEDLPPDDVQRKARDLYQVFIQREAALALNLSATNLQKLITAFTSEQPVDRRVFDDALKECFKLMNDGLARFLRSDKYRNFVKHAPDFEGDMLRNKEVGLDLNVTVDQYLKQLEGLHRQYSGVGFPGGSGATGDNVVTPRKPSRASLVSNFTRKGDHTVPLATSKEEYEDDTDDEKSRPLSMRVRKSIAQQEPPSVERKRGASLVQIIAQQTLSTGTTSRKSIVEPATSSGGGVNSSHEG